MKIGALPAEVDNAHDRLFGAAINRVVAELLAKLRFAFTKSRARKTIRPSSKARTGASSASR
ncbi:MAG: hypothetical protein PHX35_03200 [Candidatus Bipolaricaulis anaerobius]|nr:hypothetical protein [Candidatus Bipolaricaulis anaerobius]